MSTLKVDTIQKRTGTGTINVGQSGDTIAMPSATLTTALPITSGGTGGTSFSAAGLANTPSFFAFLSSNQTITSGAATKVQFNTEVLDTDNTYDNSTNYRFTPGVAGKYYIYSGGLCGAGSENLTEAEMYIYVNGSTTNSSKTSFNHQNQRANVVTPYTCMVVDASATDYFEVYATITDSSGNPSLFGDSNQRRTYFGAYKLIGA